MVSIKGGFYKRRFHYEQTKKVWAAMMLSVVLLIPSGVYAAEVDDNVEEVISEYVNTNEVTASLSISAGTANCNARNVMIKNHESKITMTLQKSTDKSSYSKVTAWSQTYTGTGIKKLEKTKSVSSGYYYRVKVVVRVYSGDEVIEKITKYSTATYY